MSQKFGIDETMEAIDGVEALTVSVVNHAKDGFQPMDVFKIINETVAPIIQAFEGAGEIDDEIKDFDRGEAKEVGERAIEMLYNIFDALGIPKENQPDIVLGEPDVGEDTV